MVREDVAEPVRMERPSLVIRSVMGPGGADVAREDMLGASLAD